MQLFCLVSPCKTSSYSCLKGRISVWNLVAVEMRDVEKSGIWCVKMMTIMKAIIMTQMMKMMNSFILIFYLKATICIQHVLYLVVIKSVSWNFDDLKLNFLVMKTPQKLCFYHIWVGLWRKSPLELHST